MDQSFQQSTAQAMPSMQNPQGGVSSELNLAPQTGLQAGDAQQVLGQQNVRISVPVHAPAATNTKPRVESPESASIVPLIVLAAVLLATAHAYTLWRKKRRRQRVQTAHETVVVHDAKPPNKKPKKAKKKRKAHHR